MASPAAGFFGKLPSAGDFVQRRLPASFVDAWDGHFESAVAQSRQALGSGWHDAYHASPVWRFLLPSGVCGESAWIGIMGPSVDRVGRCFPMVIAAAVVEVDANATLLLDRADWFDAVEAVYKAAHNDTGMGVEAFDAQLAALPGPLDAAPPDALNLLHDIDWTAATHWRLPLPASAGTGSFLSALWARMAANSGDWCLWWSRGGMRVPRSVLTTLGLPKPSAYAGFLDALHASSDWHALGTFDQHAPMRAETRVSVELTQPATVASPPAAPGVAPSAWIPDDLELLRELDSTAVVTMPPAPVVGDVAVAREPGAQVAVLRRADDHMTLLAAETACVDPRQRAVVEVLQIARDLVAAELNSGLQLLCTRILALNPSLQQASEDLIDPVPADCAVIAMHLLSGRAELVQIGAACAWHWQQGQLQPIFGSTTTQTLPSAASADDFDDLLFSRGSATSLGLGATAHPLCNHATCGVKAGDRVLLMATDALLQLPPEVLARSLAMPACDDAHRHLATAAGIGLDPARWPFAIIEVDA